MAMRKSNVLARLREGSLVSCTKINLCNAQATELAALSGFDCVWVDQEHIGEDWSMIASQVWSTKAHNKDLLVRVSRGSYSDLIKPLEMDAAGIMVPHVMAAEEAKQIVYKTRFHPIGRRAIDGGNADGGYTTTDFLDYLQTANRERFIILQIEDPEALVAIDQIAAVEGFDMLFFGPGDFSQGIGHPGQFDHPEIHKARELVAKTAIKHGKFAGTVAPLAKLAEYQEMGYRFLSVGADVVGLSSYYKSILEGFNTTGNQHATNSNIYK